MSFISAAENVMLWFSMQNGIFVRASRDCHHFDPLASSQPHTWDRYLPMLTRLVLSSVIHGCSSIFHGIPRRLGFFSRLLDLGQFRATRSRKRRLTSFQ